MSAIASVQELPSVEGQDVIVGNVSTMPVYTQSLPDHVPHVSFHLDTAEGTGYNVHANGDLAEFAREVVRRHCNVTVTLGRVYRMNPNQVTLDIDAAALDTIPVPATDRVERDEIGELER